MSNDIFHLKKSDDKVQTELDNVYAAPQDSAADPQSMDKVVFDLLQ